MGIEFNKTFGAPQQNNTNSNSSREQRPAAQFWLNVGYNVELDYSDGTKENRFVSLPVGIPLDTMEPLAVKGRNDDFAAFQSARNDLLEQIMAVANNMKPGDEQTLSLEIQLRRVQGEREAIKSEDNPFARKVELVLAPTAE